ncbi:MAG: caspase family protein, partial [Xenococcaceae cyanobacterium]
MPEFTRNMAFVIGINNYQNGISPLQNAVNDAKKLIEILREKHGYQVWVCLDETATLSNLNNLLEQTLPRQIQPNDRLLFYFAGHGTIDGESDDGPTGYLIPQDAKRGDNQTYLPMTQLYESLNNLRCRHFLGILDCCYAGAFRWLTTRDLLKAPEKIYRQRYDRYIKDPAWQIIASAAYDQKALDGDPFAFERDQIGNNSVFAAVLLEALQGKAEDDPFKEGVITATKLYSYLRDRIETEALGDRIRQTPTLIQLGRHDKGEYIFLTPGHRLNLEDAPPLNEQDNPYKGLQSFEEED